MQIPLLSPEEENIIKHKGTEAPFTNKYDDYWEPGTYYCRACGIPLYESTAKFHLTYICGIN